MSPLAVAVVGYIGVVLVTSLLSAGLWTSRKGMVPFVCLLPGLSVYPLFWGAPGIWGVVIGMSALLFFLRSLDAVATMRHLSPREFPIYALWQSIHPDEKCTPGPRQELVIRLVRGLLLLGLSFGLIFMGKRWRLWETSPYLDDLVMAVEVGSGFFGSIELFTLLAWATGLDFLAEGMAPDFAWAPSLGRFWGTHWNIPTAGVLRRGIYVPVGGRSAMLRGVLLVFFACGVMHAAPLILGGGDRRLWGALVAGTLLFFLIHAAAVVLEGLVPALRRGLLGRVYFYLVLAGSLALYPSPLLIAAGIHDRPPESATLIVLLRSFGVGFS